MTVVLPRLEREAAHEIIGRLVSADLGEIAAAMPIVGDRVTYSPVGGTRVGDEELRSIRAAVVALAREQGMPGPLKRAADFDGPAARLLHDRLQMTPHEAAHEEVWSFLTCCWLLDVAVWRFGVEADKRRFVGDVNRNTFRRLWWRAEVLGPDIELTRLGEDELVNIMERTTITENRRLAQAFASAFIRRIDAGETASRMFLMREATKRLLRLTPFVSFSALETVDLELVVGDVYDAAAAGMSGVAFALPQRVAANVPGAADEVVSVTRMEMTQDAETPAAPVGGPEILTDFETVSQAALDIARRTGRVTNMNLREVVAITSEEAREVFQVLMAEGLLVRRGVKRGTHYVLPEEVATESSPDSLSTPETDAAESTERFVAQHPATRTKPTDTPLRRLLRRGR